MAAQLSAMGIFVAVFALAALRGVHLGIMMFAAGCGVGAWLAGMPLRDVVRGFPVGIMVLLVGVTDFFGIAGVNGTIDRVIKRILGRVGRNAVVLPVAFFVITAGIAAMGSPLAGLVMAPLGLPAARREGIDPVLMALAIGNGISAGAFAPTSLFGMVSYGTAHQAGIDLNPFTLLGVAVPRPGQQSLTTRPTSINDAARSECQVNRVGVRARREAFVCCSAVSRTQNPEPRTRTRPRT